jgi:hypothetical protein
MQAIQYRSLSETAIETPFGVKVLICIVSISLVMNIIQLAMISNLRQGNCE